MTSSEDRRSVLGRLPDVPAGADALIWPGSQASMRLSGPLGSAADRWLSNRGLHPVSPSNRFGAQSSTFTRRPFELSAGLLTSIFPRLTPAGAERFVAPLNLYLQRYSIDSVCRMAAFFGQVGVESGELMVLEENLRYTTAKRLLDIFPSALRGVDIAPLVNAPEALANVVYAKRNGNGDASSGDGWKYRGRGLMHLTGRANYEAFELHSRMGVVDNPDLLTGPAGAAWSACWYWHERGLNALADTNNFDALTRRINAARVDSGRRFEISNLAAISLRRAVRWQAFEW